jgi:flagellar biosynthesis/type III secretory pathway chaperone
MIYFDKLENGSDLEVLLEPKKRLHDIIIETDGSMLKFHKTVKTSKELEILADEVFAAKERVKAIKNKSTTIRIDNLSNKIHRLKGIIGTEVDFI